MTTPDAVMTALRASACMNNIGISLLNKGYSQLSISVLIDAITILKSLFLESPQVNTQGCRPPNESIHHGLLQRAYGLSATHPNHCSLNQPSISFRRVSHNDCPSTVLQERMVSNSNPRGDSEENLHFFLIRIDCLENTLIEPEEPPRLETSVMLYNLAVAFRVAAVVTGRTVGAVATGDSNLPRWQRVLGGAAHTLDTGQVPRYCRDGYLLVRILILLQQPREDSSVSGSGPADDSSRLAAILESLVLTWPAVWSSCTHVASAA